MIKSVTYNDIIKELGNEIVKQAEIQKSRFLNADSVRGVDLKKIIAETNVQSIDLKDIVITFELLEKEADDNTIITEEDFSTSIYACYNMTLHIYGNMCSQMSQKIRARMKSQNVALSLREKGIFVTSVENIMNTKEFINNTLWLRCDLLIEIKVRYNFKSLEKIEYFNTNQKNIKINIKNI